MSYYMNMSTLNEGKIKDFLNKKAYQRKEENRKKEMEKHRGEQAEPYKRRKEEEKKTNEKQELDRLRRRTYAGNAGIGTTPEERNKRSVGIVFRDEARAAKRADFESGLRRYGRIDNKELNHVQRDSIFERPVRARYKIDTADAILRHNRRHPDRYIESGIFSECNFIEFAY